MAITAYTVITTICVLYIFHHNADIPVPGWLQVIMFNCLGRVFCIGGKTHRHGKTRSYSKSNICPKLSFNKGINITDIENNSSKTFESIVTFPPEIMELTKKMLQKREEDERHEKNKEDWQKVAIILDRFFLLLSVFGIAILSITIFVSIRTG